MRQHGFSLLELLLVMILMAVILALSLPSFGVFWKRSYDQIASAQLLRAIALTRSEAIVRGESAMLCKSRDQKTCSGDWRDGYIILVNSRVLHVFQNQFMQGVLHWRAFGKSDVLEFLPVGGSSNGTFWYCVGVDENPRWAIVINKSSRARIVYPDRVGMIYDEKGKKLLC